jgi:hypothetical protein
MGKPLVLMVVAVVMSSLPLPRHFSERLIGCEIGHYQHGSCVYDECLRVASMIIPPKGYHIPHTDRQAASQTKRYSSSAPT